MPAVRWAQLCHELRRAEKEKAIVAMVMCMSVRVSAGSAASSSTTPLADAGHTGGSA